MQHPLDHGIVITAAGRQPAGDAHHNIAFVTQFEELDSRITKQRLVRPGEARGDCLRRTGTCNHDAIRRHADVEKLGVAPVGLDRNDGYFPVLIDHRQRVQSACDSGNSENCPCNEGLDHYAFVPGPGFRPSLVKVPAPAHMQGADL